jgi:phosphatidylglycerol---prolipoprotein diacylglyceryl transferase
MGFAPDLIKLLRLGSPFGRKHMRLLAIPYPIIDPVALQLGPLSVKWYGLAYIAGLLLGWLYIKRLLDQRQLWAGDKPPLEPQRVDDLLIYMTAGVLLGGRLGYVLFYEPRYFFMNPLDIPAVWKGGMAFHGGLLGSILAILVFARRNNANPWSMLDLCAAATPIGLFFGRVANFINAELVGRPSTVPWAMVFPGADMVERHPSQLYEAFFEGLVLFAVLWWLTHKLLALRRPGLVAGTFMLGYGLARSFCELFREPDPGHVLTLGPFTAGILYSLPMIAIGIWLLRDAVRRTPASADAQRPG